MALDTSTLGNAFLVASDGNIPKKQSDQSETLPENVALAASLECLFDSNTVEIDNPRRLPDALLNSYSAGTRELMLLTQDKHVYPATLLSFTEAHLVVRMKYTAGTIRLDRKRDQSTIAVFMGDDDRKYTLQGRVLKVDARGVHIRYGSPRHDFRSVVKLAEPGIVHTLSPTRNLELLAEELKPVREITSLTSSNGYNQITRIEDVLSDPQGDSLYRPSEYVQAETATPAIVHDLSLGGTQLILDEPLPDSSDKRLLHIKLDLPPAETFRQTTCLNILSALIVSRRFDGKVHLHCRFTHRLPDDLGKLFEHLPQQ